MYNTQKWQHKLFSRYKSLGLTVVCCEPQGILTFTSFEFMNSCTAYRNNETCEVGDLCKGVIRFCTYETAKVSLVSFKTVFPIKYGIKITVWDIIQCSVRSLFEVRRKQQAPSKILSRLPDVTYQKTIFRVITVRISNLVQMNPVHSFSPYFLIFILILSSQYIYVNT